MFPKMYEKRKGQCPPDIKRDIYVLYDICQQLKPKLDALGKEVPFTCRELGYDIDKYLRDKDSK